jgi:uncharacterized protein
MTLLPTALACLVIFLAAIVRGYSGFGFSLLSISALTLIFSPAEIVPSIFFLEVAASIHLLPGVWKDIHWKSLVPLIVGCFIATPFGVWLLANVPAQPMQIAIALFVLASVGLMAVGFALKHMPGTLASAAAGAASGLANGAFGIGGPPVVLFFFASPAGAAVGRASVIAFFLATDIIGLANQSLHGLVTREVLLRAALFLPLLVAGIWVGSRSFKSANPQTFRKWVLAILALLALLVLAKAIVQAA